MPGLLGHCVGELARGGINILALHQNMRAVDIQFVVERDDYEDAIRALHECVIESVEDDQSIADLVRVA